jgi:hypothetical protein
MEAGLSGNDLGEILKLIANLLVLAAWLWRHRPQG